MITTSISFFTRGIGERRLNYFDAFHVATAKIHDLSVITGDTYIIQHQRELGIRAIDLRMI